MAGRPRRSIHMSTSRRRPVTGERSLAGAVAVVAGATRGAGRGIAPVTGDWFGDPASVVERTAAKDEALSHPATTDEDQGCPRYADGLGPGLTLRAR